MPAMRHALRCDAPQVDGTFFAEPPDQLRQFQFAVGRQKPRAFSGRTPTANIFFHDGDRETIAHQRVRRREACGSRPDNLINESFLFR